MTIPKALYSLAILTVLFVVSSSQTVCNPECKAKEPFNCDDVLTFNRSGFAKNFTFGAATSAYQKKFRSSGDLACDSYHLYKEDVALLVKLKAQAYPILNSMVKGLTK
ncbi:unnamed protein product [Microthlaspi erraticum]|uniref:Uncharacterized protein n=1 Tax=Microthlaspi erraticum TaxID=1685480 RepID=A0A6D2K7U1_9BRAS|nr:unnamed protein product [Microthlaspi erraticum]